MLRGLILLSVGFIIANRLEARLAQKKNADYEKERLEAWNDGAVDATLEDSFPASDPPSFSPGNAAQGPH